MYTFKFASCRGADFTVQGDSPKDAYTRLVDREMENGTLWRLHDTIRNTFAIQKQGFRPLSTDRGAKGPVYRIVDHDYDIVDDEDILETYG